MDTLERAIRSALEKGNASDRAYREKVYQSAFAALERALANPNMSPESSVARRTSFQETIARVEGEYLAAARAGKPRETDAAPSVSSREQADSARAAEPVVPVSRDRQDFADDLRAEPRLEPRQRAEPSSHNRAPRRDPVRIEPAMDDRDDDPEALDEYHIGADLDENVRGESRAVRRQRRPFAWFFIIVTLLALVILGAWWAYSSGMLTSSQSRNGSVPNPSPVREEEDYNPDGSVDNAAPRLGNQAQDANATELFTPGEENDVTVPGDASADLVEDGEETALRIRSGTSGSAIAFNIPQDVLQTLAGRHALFVIEAQAEEGDETQISISCSFGELGDCGGRRRFDLAGERNDVIFDVDLPDVQPGSDGTIAIVSDVSNAGKAADIFSIRVSGN